MKAGRIRELLKDIPDDAEIKITDMSFSDGAGIKGRYPSRIRCKYGGKEWHPWHNCISDYEYKSNDTEIEFTSNIPEYYIMTFREFYTIA